MAKTIFACATVEAFLGVLRYSDSVCFPCWHGISVRTSLFGPVRDVVPFQDQTCCTGFSLRCPMQGPMLSKTVAVNVTGDGCSV